MASYTSDQIAEMVKRALAEMAQSGASSGTPAADDMSIPIGVSNRHIHLTQEHVDILFGKGYTLTPIKDLSQPGQFACKETLTLIGPSMRPIEGVRVLGPLRKQSQVEISVTDSYVLKRTPSVSA